MTVRGKTDTIKLLALPLIFFSKLKLVKIRIYGSKKVEIIKMQKG